MIVERIINRCKFRNGVDVSIIKELKIFIINILKDLVEKVDNVKWLIEF